MKPNQILKPMAASTAAQSETAFSGLFATIVRGSTALGLGCMAAAVESLRSNAAGFLFQFSMGTIAAFALGAAVGLVFWKLAAGSPLAGKAGAALLLMVGLGGFLYPLRFVPAEHMADIAVGLSVATCAVSIGGVLFWRMKLFFDKDDAAEEAKKQ